MTAMTLEEAVQHVTKTNPTFAVTQQQIDGVTYKVFENIPSHLRALLQACREVQGNGAAEYLAYRDESWTYDEFCTDIQQVAAGLEQRFGVAKGQPVAIAMQNCPELLILAMAIASLGAVTVFVNAWWTTEELEYALTDSGATLVFADPPRLDRLLPLKDPMGLDLVGVRDSENLAPTSYSSLRDAVKSAGWSETAIAPDDDFAIMYSSGSTGHPKGVVLTHRGALNATFTWLMLAVMAPLMDPPAPDAPVAPRHTFIVVTPLFHATATHPVFLLSLPAGAKLVLLPKWNVDEAIDLIQRHRVTRFIGVPTQTADLMEAAKARGIRLDSLSMLGSGGAKRPPAQVRELAQHFDKVQVATGWGMTETNANGIGFMGQEYVDHPGAAGRLYPPVQELRFLDENGVEVPTGTVGEITVKSPCNMRCYLNKPNATAAVLKDGWLRTGDLGFIDAEGVVTIVDRIKNIIIRGGENIACLDVEAAMHRHPAVAEACAFSVPHDRLGETVGAGIQIKPGQSLTAQELADELAVHIARFKIPEHIWFQASPLPRGATDKIDRRALRDRCLAEMEAAERPRKP